MPCKSFTGFIPTTTLWADTKRADMINKVCGSKQIRQRFLSHHQWQDAKEYWDKDVDNFRKTAKKYYLYK